MNAAQAHGYKIGIISWLSKTSSPAFDKAVTVAKMHWLAQHLHSVKFDEIHIVKYGTPKYLFAHSTEDILFDDEENNRIAWTGTAYLPDEIISVMKHFWHFCTGAS